MRIPSFRIENQRSVRFAECTATPKLMVIAGPNGSGKSTLLNGLRYLSGQGPILYVGPHRNARVRRFNGGICSHPRYLWKIFLLGKTCPGMKASSL